MFCGAMTIVTERVALGSTPLEAVIENVYEPVAVGDPESTPPVESDSPGGSNATSTAAKVMVFGAPTATKVCVYRVLTFPVGTTVAVNTGANAGTGGISIRRMR
jgi:hypothetical protein